VLLAPKSTDNPYYAEFGWIGSGTPAMPNDQTVWTLKSGDTLSPGHPVMLTWDNGQGLVFTRAIAIDDKYMFTIADSVANTSGPAVTLYPFAYVAREGTPRETSNLALHVGFVGIAGNSLKQAGYKDFKADTPPTSFSSTDGWLGITDKYWMAAVVPPQGETFNGAFLGTTLTGGTMAYQANYRLGARNLAPGATTSVTHQMFAGAKVVDTLRAYETNLHIGHFDEAVDWGPWLWVFTRPIFWLLDTFYKVLGNFGLAILALTVVIKLLFFPLANAQFKSMSKMKKVQPEMERLKKLHSDDPQKQQMAVMELYKQEKLNPLAGCFPILIQIPVFFSLYKVLYVTIEMRQAPFFGWIHDLSAPDPTSLINLFGLLPFDPHAVLPSFLAILSIGVWPVLYGITMFVQTKLNPAPPDPVQAQMLTYMPLIFTFMFGTFPAGLVIYYAWNNLLTIAQQWFIMHKEGVEVQLFANLRPRKAAK
jgi:YidC/Oxa1 family membrane protein insertase